MFSAWVSRWGRRGSCSCLEPGCRGQGHQKAGPVLSSGHRQGFSWDTDEAEPSAAGGRRPLRQLLRQPGCCPPAPVLPPALRARRVSWFLRQASALQGTSLLSEEYVSPVTSLSPSRAFLRCDRTPESAGCDLLLCTLLCSPSREQPVREAESQAHLDLRAQHLAVGFQVRTQICRESVGTTRVHLRAACLPIGLPPSLSHSCDPTRVS